MIIRAVLPHREEFIAPGALLDRKSHARLFEELDHIAAGLKERPLSEVYLTADVNAWVTDRGGVLSLRGRRVMAVGLPLMAILSVSQLRAILAHEFGHYYGGDARLAPKVYKTHRAMLRTREELISYSEAITFILHPKLVWLAITKAVVAYIDLFLRVTTGISQRQEVRADELACWIADSQSLIEALKRMHAASEAFPQFWEQEVLPILAAGYRPPIAEGFGLYLEAPEVASECQKTLETKLKPSLAGWLTAYDSHPPLSDRIVHASVMQSEAGVRNEEPATTLLGDIGADELQLLQELNPDFRTTTRLETVGWQEVAQLVLVPSWRKMIARVSPSLDRLTAQMLPNAVERLSDIGARIPNPRGRLLSPDERTQRARGVLDMALGLALLNNGWQLQYAPGGYYLRSGNRTLSITHLMDKLCSGEISEDDWEQQCHTLGIAELRLDEGALQRAVT